MALTRARFGYGHADSGKEGNENIPCSKKLVNSVCFASSSGRSGLCKRNPQRMHGQDFLRVQVVRGLVCLGTWKGMDDSVPRERRRL